jgi:hypothetical protein
LPVVDNKAASLMLEQSITLAPRSPSRLPESRYDLDALTRLRSIAYVRHALR